MRSLRRWAKVLGVFAALFFGATKAAHVLLNDEKLARFVSGAISSSMRGHGGPQDRAFSFEKIHWPYWRGVQSLVFNTPMPFEMWGLGIYDPEGGEVISAKHGTGRIQLGRVVWHAVGSLITRTMDVQVFVSDVDVDGARGKIVPISTGLTAAKVNLVEAFKGKRQRKPDDPPDRGGLVISVENARLHDAHYEMGFPGWYATADGMEADIERLRFSTFPKEQAVDKPAFIYHLRALSAAKGKLTLGGAWEFPIEELVASRFEAVDPDRQDLQFKARGTTRGAPVVAEGKLADIYGSRSGVDLRLDFDKGAGLLAMLNAKQVLGGDPRGWVRFVGPFSEVKIGGAFEGGEFRAVDLLARDVRGDFRLDRGHLLLSKLDAGLGGGRIGGDVDLDLGRLAWKAQLHSDGVDPARLAPLVPEAAFSTLGGRLDGTARFAGSLAVPSHVRVHGIDARLSRRNNDKLPRRVDIHGGLALAPGRIGLLNFSLAGEGLAATFHGHVNPDQETIDADLQVEGHGLAGLLRRFELPPVVEGLRAEGHVAGSWFEPAIDANARATGVGVVDRRLDEVTTHLHLAHGELQAQRLHGQGFGGTVDGDVTLGLFDGPFTRRLAVPTLKLRATAERLRVQSLLDLPAVRGEVSGRVTVDGTFDRPTGSAALSIPEVSVWGDPYKDGRFEADIDEKGLVINRMEMARTGGGRFSISGRGRVGWDKSLDVDVRPRDFPLRAIPPLRESKVLFEGLLSGAVHLGGALGNWIPGGVIEATRVKVRDVLFGDGQLKLKPTGNTIRLAGEFFDRFRIEGWLTLVPHVAGDLTISFDGLPLEELIPELRQLAEVRSRATGWARIAFDVNDGTSNTELHLQKLLLTFAESEADPDPSARDDQLVNEDEVIVKTSGRVITVEKLRLGYEGMQGGRFTRIGGLEVAGFVGPDRSDLRAVGKLDLRLLEFFASSLFKHTHGSATANLRLTGPMAHPVIGGSLDFENAGLEPQGTDRPFIVPTGRLRFDDEGIKLTGLRFRLDEAEATAQGSLGMNWKETKLGDLKVDVRGELSATLLAWIFRDAVSDPVGQFAVQVRVTGPITEPRWDGRVNLADVGFHVKPLGRDVRILSGTLRLRDSDVIVGCPTPADGCRNVVARVDERSELRVDGTLNLRGGLVAPALGPLVLRIDGESLEYSASGVATITFSPRRVVLEGTGEKLRLAGELNLVNARYYQDFDVIRDVAIQPRAVESDPPFWEGIPVLEKMELDILGTASGPLFVKNNLADLNLSMASLRVTGTLANPILDGTVYVDPGGRFNLPLLRGEFTSESGTITFEEHERFPDHTPRLDIHAGTDWQDRYDQLHHINLVVRGTYREPDLDLNSTDGWDKSRVLVALFTGSTPDEIRRGAADTGGGRSVVNPSDGTFKSIMGSVLRPIENPLLEVTRFDVVRLELGYDSVFIKLCPYNRRAFRLCATGDVGFVSTTRYDARGELKLLDSLSLVGSVEHIEFGVDTSEDVVTRGRLQLTLRYPLFW